MDLMESLNSETFYPIHREQTYREQIHADPELSERDRYNKLATSEQRYEFLEHKYLESLTVATMRIYCVDDAFDQFRYETSPTAEKVEMDLQYQADFAKAALEYTLLNLAICIDPLVQDYDHRHGRADHEALQGASIRNITSAEKEYKQNANDYQKPAGEKTMIAKLKRRVTGDLSPTAIPSTVFHLKDPVYWDGSTNQTLTTRQFNSLSEDRKAEVTVVRKVYAVNAAFLNSGDKNTSRSLVVYIPPKGNENPKIPYDPINSDIHTILNPESDRDFAARVAKDKTLVGTTTPIYIRPDISVNDLGFEAAPRVKVSIKTPDGKVVIVEAISKFSRVLLGEEYNRTMFAIKQGILSSTSVDDAKRVLLSETKQREGKFQLMESTMYKRDQDGKLILDHNNLPILVEDSTSNLIVMNPFRGRAVDAGGLDNGKNGKTIIVVPDKIIGINALNEVVKDVRTSLAPFGPLGSIRWGELKQIASSVYKFFTSKISEVEKLSKDQTGAYFIDNLLEGLTFGNFIYQKASGNNVRLFRALSYLLNVDVYNWITGLCGPNSVRPHNRFVQKANGFVYRGGFDKADTTIVYDVPIDPHHLAEPFILNVANWAYGLGIQLTGEIAGGAWHLADSKGEPKTSPVDVLINTQNADITALATAVSKHAGQPTAAQILSIQLRNELNMNLSSTIGAENWVKQFFRNDTSLETKAYGNSLQILKIVQKKWPQATGSYVTVDIEGKPHRGLSVNIGGQLFFSEEGSQGIFHSITDSQINKSNTGEDQKIDITPALWPSIIKKTINIDQSYFPTLMAARHQLDVHFSNTKKDIVNYGYSYSAIMEMLFPRKTPGGVAKALNPSDEGLQTLLNVLLSLDEPVLESHITSSINVKASTNNTGNSQTASSGGKSIEALPLLKEVLWASAFLDLYPQFKGKGYSLTELQAIMSTLKLGSEKGEVVTRRALFKSLAKLVAGGLLHG